MKNKILIIGLMVAALLAAYLFWAHHRIYREIGKMSLPASDIGHEYAVGSNSSESTKLTYTAIGDSLTAGVGVQNYQDSYAYRLAENFASSTGAAIDFHVQAYPGARTADAVRDFLNPAINNQPDIVTILLGVNDVHGFVSEAQFTKNYTEIITRLKAETMAKIYAVNIPYLGTKEMIWPPYNYYLRYKTIKFNQIIKQLAQTNNIDYVDLYASTQDMFNNPAFYSADIFHPSAKGYELWAQIIYADINN
jgi:acyl-CoA thioesterase I